MLKNVLIFLFLFLCNCHSTYAQDTGEKFSAYLDFSKVQSLSKREKSLIRKSTLEAIFSTKRFLFNLQKPKDITGSQNEWYTVEVIIKPRSTFHDFDLKLRNNFDNIVYNHIVKKGISRDRVQLTYRKMIYKLLYGENYDAENNKIINNKIISLAGKGDRIKLNKPVDPEEGDDSIESESPSDKDDKKKEKEEKKKKKKINEIKLQDFDAVDLNLETIPREEKIVEIDSLNWLNDYVLSSGYTIENTNVDLLLPGASGDLEPFKTITLNQKLNVGIKHNLKHRKKGNFNQFELHLAKIISEDSFGTPFDIKGYNSFFFYMPSFATFIAPKLGYERGSFVNLTSRGSGAQLYFNSSFWYGIDILHRFTLFRRTLKLTSSVMLSLVNEVESKNEEKSFQANALQYNLSAEYQLYEGFYLGLKYLNYTSEDETSQIFNLSRTETLISVIYQ